MKVCSICCTFLLLVWSGLGNGTASAQAHAPVARLRGGIGGGARAVLPGTLSPRVAHARDLGPVQGEQVLQGMTLVFRRSDAQQADLQGLLAAQQTPGSPSFHQWLTPDEFGRRFGMAEEDLEATTRWLNGQGFAVTGTSRARDRITFSGTANQVAAAFSAPLHRFQVDGEEHVAPSTDLTLPADLAAVTSAVLHLSDFRPRPSIRPAFTVSQDQAHYLTPGDLAVMYDVPPAYGVDDRPGTGQTIAIVGQSYVDVSSGTRIRSLEESTERLSLNSVLVPGTGVEAVSPGDAAETEIDLEYAGGIAPAANLLLVHVGNNQYYDLFDALTFSIDQNLAPVVSISYSVCEALLSQAELQQGNALFQQATAQGQTLVAASGDSGSTGCVRFSTSSTFSATEQQALAVGYPADSPYVTAVGGTQMAPNTFGAGSSSYWVSAAYVDSQISLLSYVPEVVWNEDTTNSIFAGGGGASAAFARPSWQIGVAGAPTGAARLIPDIALQASSGNPGFLICTDDASFLASEGQTVGCFEELRGDNGQYTLGGGTSFGAPVFAAMTAVLNQQKHAVGQGNVNPILYGLAGSSASSASIFHDITTGSTACIPGAPRCSPAGQSGYSAGPGYDEATGLGSLDFGKLAAAWPATGAASLIGSLITLYPSDTTIAPGAQYSLTVYVTSSPPMNNPTPTGSVSIAVDGVVVAPALSIADVQYGSGTAEYTMPAPSSVGSHVTVVRYSGDATHAPSTGTVTLQVGNVLATGGLTLTASDVTVPLNGIASSSVTVTPTAGYNGRVFWSFSVSGGSGGSTQGCYSIPNVTVQGVTTTTLSLGSGTACTSAQASAREALKPLIVRQASNVPASAPWRSASIAVGALVGCLLPGVRRRLLPVLCLLLVSVASGALSGCGGGSGGGGAQAPSGGGTTSTPTSYTATLTGRDSVNGAITSSTTFKLTLQ